MNLNSFDVYTHKEKRYENRTGLGFGFVCELLFCGN